MDNEILTIDFIFLFFAYYNVKLLNQDVKIIFGFTTFKDLNFFLDLLLEFFLVLRYLLERLLLKYSILVFCNFYLEILFVSVFSSNCLMSKSTSNFDLFLVRDFVGVFLLRIWER